MESKFVFLSVLPPKSIQFASRFYDTIFNSVFFYEMLCQTRGGRPTTSISSLNHILIIFSSEPPQNPRPFNIIFFKCPILENKYIF